MNQGKAAFFDRQVAAPWAAAPYGTEEAPKLARLLAESRLAPGQTVLEPGCGTGRLTRALAQAVGPRGRVVALDISAGMVAACRRQVADLPQVAVIRAGLEELEAPPASFDRAICHQVFPHFDDQAGAVTRLAGLLRPDGLLVVVHFIRLAQINDVHRKAGTAVAGDLLPPAEVMREFFAAAGLRVETLVDDALGYFLRARRP